MTPRKGHEQKNWSEEKKKMTPQKGHEKKYIWVRKKKKLTWKNLYLSERKKNDAPKGTWKQ